MTTSPTKNYSPISWRDIKQGDRVRLTLDNGDEYIFTVKRRSSTDVLEDYAGRLFYKGHKYTAIQVEEPVYKPGVYLPYKGTERGDTPNIWLLKASGTWLKLPNTTGFPVTRILPEEIRNHRNSLVYLGVGRDADEEEEDDCF